MKKYNKIITVSLLSALIIASPLVSFANGENKDNNNKQKMNYNSEIKMERENKNKSDRDNENESEDNDQIDSWYKSSWFKNNDSKITTVPTISDLETVAKKSDKISLKWNTDTRSNSYVWYSTTPQIDTNTEPTLKRGHKVLSHKLFLKKLEANTKYYIVVGSANKLGTTKSDEISFTTSSSTEIIETPVVVDIVSPIISNIEKNIDASNTTISWITDEAATSNIFYSENASVDINNTETPSITKDELTKEHSISIPGLVSNSIYHFILKSVDALGNMVTSIEYLFVAN